MTEIDPTLAAGLARPFRIVRQLGAGGVDAVFLAEQIAAGNRPVALKVLLRKLLDDPDFLQRFRNEAASTGRIRHPNVVTIYESAKATTASPTSPWNTWKASRWVKPSSGAERCQ